MTDSAKESWTVYILACADGSLYTGIARDVAARLIQHEKGQGAKYTRGRGPYSVVYTEAHATRGMALQREAAIKALSRAQKDGLISAASTRR